MLISIVVPVYNSSAYLEECIDSILSQTYANFELYLINDGSKDNSGEIIDAYSRKDSRINAVHKTNSGVSDTRNVGIRSAKGEIICFIDSDDWVDQDYLEVFIENFHDHQTLLIQNIKRDGKTISNYRFKNYSLKNELADLFAENNLLRSGAPFAKFYSRSIISDNQLFFNTDISYGEDLIFFLEYVKHLKNVTFLNATTYNYRYIPGSLSTSKNHSLKNYFLVHIKISEFINFSKILSNNNLKYFYKIDWDMIESGIDQNIHISSSKIRKDLTPFKKTIHYQHFKFASIGRKILFLLIKINSIRLLKAYKILLK
ncbi:glycosyltransferase family 2 protein [Chryseobacterium chendengshani]|uniref:glycosyltransferase family 2 protein n=1 Tax=Chryseobacterium sp. LJ756 TaxID=2864113 RepID=UPI001C63EDD3|nr:glycosyltransferase family 2 protein [Chryseobacterium sp. LJ756]MBW7675594.1 glycosyltransferase family 2 protein [Chryseobacterium sp. LJ756]